MMNEIFRLKAMLEQAGIPFEFYDRSFPATDDGMLYYEDYQIAYPTLDMDHRVCSVLEGIHSYGNRADTLELMGLLTYEEQQMDCVRGWLSAEDVFGRIQAYHQKYVISRRAKQP